MKQVYLITFTNILVVSLNSFATVDGLMRKESKSVCGAGMAFLNLGKSPRVALVYLELSWKTQGASGLMGNEGLHARCGFSSCLEWLLRAANLCPFEVALSGVVVRPKCDRVIAEEVRELRCDVVGLRGAKGGVMRVGVVPAAVIYYFLRRCSKWGMKS